MYIYSTRGYWMWMFDGRPHTARNPDYSLLPRGRRPCTLWWGVFEAPTRRPRGLARAVCARRNSKGPQQQPASHRPTPTRTPHP